MTYGYRGYDSSVTEADSDETNGLSFLQIVELSNKAIDEARKRVRSATANSPTRLPKNQIAINLTPAELPKDGAHYDIPIKLAVLCASGQLRQKELDRSIFTSEPALDGSLRGYGHHKDR